MRFDLPAQDAPLVLDHRSRRGATSRSREFVLKFVEVCYQFTAVSLVMSIIGNRTLAYASSIEDPPRVEESLMKMYRDIEVLPRESQHWEHAMEPQHCLLPIATSIGFEYSNE